MIQHQRTRVLAFVKPTSRPSQERTDKQREREGKTARAMRKITAAVSSPSRSLPTKTMTDPASRLYRAVAEGRSVDEVCAAVEACAPPGPVTRSSNSAGSRPLTASSATTAAARRPCRGLGEGRMAD